ncbi:MAG: O-antigen ligase family protein [Chloroflexota bacterium]
MLPSISGFRRQLLAPYPTALQRWLLKGAVILAVPVLSILAGLKPTILLLLPIAAVAALVVLTKQPEIGLVATVVAGLAVPFSLGTGTATRIPAPMLVIGGMVGLWALNAVTGKWYGRVRWSRPLLPLLLLILTTLLAFILGLLPWYDFAPGASLAAQLGGVTLFVFSALSFFWVSQQVEDLRWLELATWIFVAISVLLLMSEFWDPFSKIGNRLFTSGLVKGSMFWVWLAALLFAQILFNRRLHPAVRLALTAILGLQLYVAYVTNGDWKSGWVPPLVALGAILLLRYPRLSILFGLLAIIPAFDVVQDLIQAEQYSYSTRIEAWEIVAEIVKVNPVLGLGPSNYYFYTPLFPIRGYAVEFNSHNQYIDLIAQVGIVGLIFFLWFLAEIGRMAWRLRTRVEEGFHKAYVYAVFGGLVSSAFAGMLGDWMIPFVYNVGFRGFRASMFAWIFFGGLLAIAYQKGEANDA